MLRICAPIAILLVGVVIVVAFLLAVQSEMAAISERLMRIDRSAGQSLPCVSSNVRNAQPREFHNNCVEWRAD